MDKVSEKISRVLYLSEWYPTQRDKMVGLFVQKHAEAVAAQGVEVRVNTWWPEAEIVQLNVLTLKMGLIAYVLKRVFGIPYIIIEHWSTYLPENGSYLKQSRWKRAVLEEIAREADGIYPVSRQLEEAMKACGITNRVWGRVYNVVDDFFYSAKCQVRSAKCVQLLHVSCFDEAPKNVKGLLRAVKAISEKRQDFGLTLVGTGKDWQMCRDYADELDIPKEMLRWTGELTPREVCQEMCEADVFSCRVGGKHMVYLWPKRWLSEYLLSRRMRADCVWTLRVVCLSPQTMRPWRMPSNICWTTIRSMTENVSAIMARSIAMIWWENNW